MADNDDDPLLDNHDVVVESSQENLIRKSIESIDDWFLWSYLNVLVGGVIFGLIAIGCSLRTYKFKQRQNYSKAYKWSYVTLMVNCMGTLSGFTLCGYYIFLSFYGNK